MSQTPLKLIFVVVIAIAILALIGFGSLCAALFLHVYADAAIITSIMTMTGALIGYLGGILSNPRQSPPEAQTVQTTTQTINPASTSDKPQEVIVTNPPETPVNTTEIP